MRKILEAYGTFNYKCGIWDIPDDSSVWNKIEDAELRETIRSYMYKLLLNEDSHSGDRARTLDGLPYTEQICDEERQYTAKVILVMLYSFDKAHLQAHLKDVSTDWETDIIDWRDHEILRQ